MASVSGNMKGFYRQRKNANSNSSKSKSSSSNNKKSPLHASTVCSEVTHPPSLVSHADDCNENEAILRQFDMNMAYGPCLGMTRLERWERAHKLGLNPPREIERLLKGGKVQTQCLWEGLI